MALLGQSGRLTLKREDPDPLVFTPKALNRNANAFNSADTKYWSGDKVTIFAEDGLPTDFVPQGTAQYGWPNNQWKLGPSRIHISDDDDAFYRNDDTVFFYEQETAATVTSRTVYIGRDLLGRISFYENQSDALAGTAKGRLNIDNYDWDVLLLMPFGTGDYENSVMSMLGNFDTKDYERAQIGELPLQATQQSALAWEFVCELRSWEFETDAAAIDTTPVGVKFGEAVKSLVTGAGRLDFFVDRTAADWDGHRLMQLVLMTEKGSKAKAQFWMTMGEAADGCAGNGRLPGALYYEADILLTSCAVSVRVEEAITGSAAFSTTGEIALRMGL